ncbi:sensor histidine kinase [Nocardia sp. NPDC127579]|uniref:sensor histidine kinase n=1 Tax=Nocardia sp. NPDC127579 TaxID=3345402 RepID=UPI00363A8C47
MTDLVNPEMVGGIVNRSTQILDRYRQGLEDVGSPLVAVQSIWEECAEQARQIISDCAKSMELGQVIQGRNLDLIKTMAAGRADRGIRPDCSVVAAGILFEIMVDEINRAFESEAGHAGRLEPVLITLGRALFRRLEAGASGYDSFLLGQLGEINDSARHRLARDLHDRLGNELGLSMRQLELYAAENPSGGRDVQPVIATLSNAIDRISAIITDLRLREELQSLETALQAFVSVMRSQTPAVDIMVNGAEYWVDRDVLDELFLILRECLRNVYLHARAERAAVVVNIAPHEISAIVADDGTGFDPAVVERSNGIQSMTERAELLSGSVTISSTLNRGTRVRIWIPIQETRG